MPRGHNITSRRSSQERKSKRSTKPWWPWATPVVTKRGGETILICRVWQRVECWGPSLIRDCWSSGGHASTETRHRVAHRPCIIAGGAAEQQPQRKLDKRGNPVPVGYSYRWHRQAQSDGDNSERSASASSKFCSGSSSFVDEVFELLEYVLQLAVFDDVAVHHNTGSSSSHPWHSSSSHHTHHDRSYDSSSSQHGSYGSSSHLDWGGSHDAGGSTMDHGGGGD